MSLLEKANIMPKGEDIANRARNALVAEYKKSNLYPFEKTYLKNHCDLILSQLLDIEFTIYQRLEREIHSEKLWALFKNDVDDNRSIPYINFEKIIKSKFDELRTFYKSISQSRASRAGGSLENHIFFIFKTLGYPFDYQQIINGTPDFILPNAKLYFKTPGESILLTAKRTLRERWRQIITEGFKSPYYFLLTIDNAQNEGNLKEMANHRIYLVMPNDIKQSKKAYIEANNVISLKSFLSDYLDPAMKRWKQSSII